MARPHVVSIEKHWGAMVRLFYQGKRQHQNTSWFKNGYTFSGEPVVNNAVEKISSIYANRIFKENKIKGRKFGKK